MRRFELMGAPGVGKSTIFRVACNARNPRDREFYRLEEARQKGGATDLWGEFGSFLDRVYGGLPAGDPIHQRRLDITKKALARARKIEGARGRAPVLIEQSLCQRGLSLWLSSRGSDLARTYFELMPAPAGVFHITADIDTIRDRNAARSADGSGVDRSEDVEACRAAAQIAAAALMVRGVPVIEIDATRPLGESVGRVFDAVRALG